MTELEAKNFLAQNWWKKLRKEKPEGVVMHVGDMIKEDEGNYWFYCFRIEPDESLPEDKDDWEIWLVGKDGKGCAPPVF